ncbi:alpha/beta fold hydrolase [Natronolimnohabitans innermongolicus]|uniref:Alpha/beta hydrolase fold protein n=1 Tax=Natronolimnohabitans innermongolicus JCM 12255 TaxID=1227499 RepID=L9WVR9_9EURY|nr:alpha/beta hydrolase [Natronolimnohabitans innermongolicus]ELY53296.1 alpha/beta hydrolase fold protein [Natronolimnohabitans innermongolicus JCM 12255]
MARHDDDSGRPGIDVAGPEGEQAIVFVHGAMFTRSMWLPQFVELQDEYRVVAPDLPGHGVRSYEPFRMDTAIDLLEGAIDDYTDGSAVLVGLSLGGYVATEYAYRHPEDVDGLVLTGCSANPTGGMATVTRAVGGLWRLATKPERGRRAVERLGYRWVRNRDLPDEIESAIIDAGIYPREFGRADPDIRDEDFRAKLSTYPGPTLILNGEHDKIMRRGEREHAAAAADGRVEVLADVGHICNLHRPQTYTTRVRHFLRQRVVPVQ